jgi:glucose-1-phosphate thymidylyltransferase
MLGDNLFSPADVEAIRQVCANIKHHHPRQKFGAHIWTIESDNPSAYGVLELDSDGKPSSIVEKPKNPKSNLITTGIYLFDCQVWDIIPNLEKSDRGEYEVTGILNAYLNLGQLHYHKLNGEWFDVGGSVDSYWKVATHIRNSGCTHWSQEREDL